MNSFVGFEFKKMFRKKMLIVQVILVILAFAGSFAYWSHKGNQLGIENFSNDATVFQSKSKVIDNFTMLVEEREKDLKSGEDLSVEVEDQINNQFPGFMSALKADNEKKLNLLALENIKLGAYGLLGEFIDIHGASSEKMKQAVYEYLVKHDISAFPPLAEGTNAWNQLAFLSGLDDFNTPTNSLNTTKVQFTQVILIVFSIILALYFTMEFRGGTDRLMAALPLRNSTQILKKLLFIVGSLFATLLIIGTLFWLVMGLNPNYGFGSSEYVYSYLLPNSKVALMSIASYLPKYLLFIFLWLLLLTMLLFFLSLLIHDPVILIALAGIFIFAQNLGLMDIKGKFATFIPMNYLNFPEIILSRGDYAAISVGQGVGTILAWTVFFLLASILIIKKRGRI